MTDKLETFIDEHLQEFDTIELPQDLWSRIDASIGLKSVVMVKSRLLRNCIYFGLSSTVIVAAIIYFVFKEQKEESSVISGEKHNEILMDATNFTIDPEKNSKTENSKKDESLQSQTSNNSIEKQNITAPDSNLNKDQSPAQHDSLKITVKQEEKLVDIAGVERGLFYHISYSGGPASGRKSQVLFWYTHKELPNTHFIVEHFCWNNWIKRGKVIAKGRPGRGEYSGKIPGKYVYKFKIPPHSGENRWRVLLMNDSNECLGVSKELRGVSQTGEPLRLVKKVDYAVKKKAKEILFSAETYYELYDPLGEFVEKGRGKMISYARLSLGTYSLNYDNYSAIIKLK